MGGEAEAAGDVLTGSIVAGTIDGPAEPAVNTASHEPCRNCGTLLNGRYCSACGQPAHLHRSLLSLGHDILHAVFHFEGKIWRTLPELFFHPGRLTRRYIDGERAKFVSPMALFLFTVFLMFAVFSFTGGVLMEPGETPASAADTNTATSTSDDWRSAIKEGMAEVDRKIESRREELTEDADLSPARRARLERQISELQASREAMDAVARGDWTKLAMLESVSTAALAAAAESSKAQGTVARSERETKVDLGWPALDNKLTEGLNRIKNNPQLLIYKMKVNAYKFCWALIPLSVPFLWLMFFWRRDIHLYDHAVFVTYSISFVMLFAILLSIGSATFGSGLWEAAIVFVPPIHLYKQLRGAYRVSRAGAFVRLFFLQISIWIVLALFAALLLVFGILD